jgi:predicted nucleic acid-binding protein
MERIRRAHRLGLVVAERVARGRPVYPGLSRGGCGGRSRRSATRASSIAVGGPSGPSPIRCCDATWPRSVPVALMRRNWRMMRRTWRIIVNFRPPEPQGRELLLSAVERGNVAWCWPVRYELVVDARGSEAIALVDRSLEGLREIPVDRAVQRGVLAVMRDLAAQGSYGNHRLPLTDLTLAVAAQHAGLEVLHNDHHFERLADLLGIRAVWIADPTG